MHHVCILCSLMQKLWESELLKPAVSRGDVIGSAGFQEVRQAEAPERDPEAGDSTHFPGRQVLSSGMRQHRLTFKAATLPLCACVSVRIHAAIETDAC